MIRIVSRMSAGSVPGPNTAATFPLSGTSSPVTLQRRTDRFRRPLPDPDVVDGIHALRIEVDLQQAGAARAVPLVEQERRVLPAADFAAELRQAGPGLVRLHGRRRLPVPTGGGQL